MGLPEGPLNRQVKERSTIIIPRIHIGTIAYERYCYVGAVRMEHSSMQRSSTFGFLSSLGVDVSSFGNEELDHPFLNSGDSQMQRSPFGFAAYVEIGSLVD